MNQGGCGLTGLSGNWSELVGEYYYGTKRPFSNNPFPSMNVSEYAFWQLLRSDSKIDVATGCRASSVGRAASSTPGCLAEVSFVCEGGKEPMTVQATYVIDASYDGDVMTMAGGIDYTFGREANTTYNESLAGVSDQDWELESFDKQNLTIDPYLDNGMLLKYIDPEPLPRIGSADDKVMAYEFFACLSKTRTNQVKFYQPPNYNPDDFTLLLRVIEGYVENGKYPDGPPLSVFGDVQCYDPIVAKTTGNVDCLFCCGTAPVDSDQPDLNRGWPAANYSRRQEIAQDHRYYTQGSLYFLANDPRVPAATRANAQSYGYCADEYKDFNNFPPQLYVRISNRLLGESFLTQNNISTPQVKPDGVAMGCWEFDQHTMSRHVVLSKTDPTKKVVANEGFFRSRDGLESWYDVPFGVMVPKRGQASNLLVPVAISVSSVAYSSARIENMFMDLGSAAGVAVALLLDARITTGGSVGTCPTIPVQDTNVTAVQGVLRNVYGQYFHGPPKPVVPDEPEWYSVVGAGSAMWNGNYTKVKERYGGKPVYISTATLECTPAVQCALYAWGGTWRIGKFGKEVFYVAANDTGALPPLTEWLVSNGTAPVPHLAEGPK